MSEHDHTPQPSSQTPDSDGMADVISTLALISLVVGAVSFWLHSFAH